MSDLLTNLAYGVTMLVVLFCAVCLVAVCVWGVMQTANRARWLREDADRLRGERAENEAMRRAERDD